MHPELRLIEDFLTDRGALSLPAQPRMLYVVRGLVTVGQRTLGQGEVLYGEDLIAAHAEGTGVTMWRFELSDPRQPPVKSTKPGVASHTKFVAPLEALPDGELLWRGDSVAFPAGGCAYLHRHQGPGIRCLIEGNLRIDTAGRSHDYEIGDAWFESGPEPGVRAGRQPAGPLHSCDDPAARADRKKLDPVRERRGQGEAEDPAIPCVRRCSADAAFLVEHDLNPKTGSHPASSAGQAFSGSCSRFFSRRVGVDRERVHAAL